MEWHVMSLFMNMLGLLWSFITACKLQIIIVPALLCEAFNVAPIYADKIILISGIIWIVVLVRPLIEFIKGLIRK